MQKPKLQDKKGWGSLWNGLPKEKAGFGSTPKNNRSHAAKKNKLSGTLY